MTNGVQQRGAGSGQRTPCWGIEMKNMIIAVGAVVLLVATFVVGARYGANAGHFELAKFNASITAYKLRHLDEEEIEPLRSSLEDDLYRYLLYHTESRRFPYSLWSSRGVSAEADTNALVHASSYWVDNNLGASFSEMFEGFSGEGEERHQDALEAVNALARRYAE